MTAKEYLQQVRTLDTLINKKREELNHLIELSTTITSGSDEERVQSSSNQDRLGTAVCKIVDLQREIDNDIVDMLELKKEIMSTIDRLVDYPEMIDLLYRRYVRFEKWEKIAYKMNYSLRGIHKLHGKALNEIEKELGNDSNQTI